EGSRRRQRILDRRQLLHLGRGTRPVSIIQVIAEKVLVIGVVPLIGFLGAWLVGFGLVLLRLFCRLELLGRHFFEQRILDHFLIQQIRKFERRHRQKLDRLLQRRRKDELLNEFCV